VLSGWLLKRSFASEVAGPQAAFEGMNQTKATSKIFAIMTSIAIKMSMYLDIIYLTKQR
jgi:hypothetical protein